MYTICTLMLYSVSFMPLVFISSYTCGFSITLRSPSHVPPCNFYAQGDSRTRSMECLYRRSFTIHKDTCEFDQSPSHSSSPHHRDSLHILPGMQIKASVVQWRVLVPDSAEFPLGTSAKSFGHISTFHNSVPSINLVTLCFAFV